MRVCMVGYTFYESDNRVMRYAETLAKRGDKVDIFALRAPGTLSFEKLDGVNVYRIQGRIFNEKGKSDYLFRVLRFLLISFWHLTIAHLTSPYDLLHVHSVPDFEVFAALVAKLMGAKVILDIHDIVPEFYAQKFKTGNRSVVYRLLLLAERLSIAFSDHVIISNHLWEKTLKARCKNPNKILTIMNYPDRTIFYRREGKRSDGKVVLLYPGSLNWHQGLDIAIKAFGLVAGKAENAQLWIYGEGPSKSFLEDLVVNLGLGDRVLINSCLPMKNIAGIMADADIGIIPKRNDAFGGQAFSTKTLEFMSLGVPIIVSRTEIDQYYFNDSVVKFFKPEDEEDLGRAMLEIIKGDDLRKTLIQNALEFVEDFSWEKRKGEYLGLIDRLTSSKIRKS
jgi:glycosyltransferase involved in cell wall biosynthesis